MSDFPIGDGKEVVPTKYWHKLDDGRVQCDVCPRECKLKEGQRGGCASCAAARTIRWY